MAEWKISRIRYTWKGTWTTATSYNKDDVVYFGASSYSCIRQHTSTDFNDDQAYTPPGDTLATPAWSKMTDGYSYLGNWATATVYGAGSIVKQGGYLWLCVTGHTSQTNLEDDQSKWAIYATTIDWDGAWTPNTRYGVGDLVKYGSTVYKCIIGHTSTADDATGLEPDLDQQDSSAAKWEVYVQVKGYVGDWVDGYRYKYNDLVSYGGSILRATVGHTASGNLNSANFETEVPGNKVRGDWDTTVYYAVGDVVQHGGYVFQSLTNNNGNNPSDSIYQVSGTPHWAIIQKGVRLAGNWSASGQYKTGDVVVRGGYTYVALLDTTADGSSLDYLDAGNWDIIVPSISWKNAWAENLTFAVGDVISYRGSAYKCNFEHVSTSQNFPGDNGEGFNYWDTLLEGTSQAGLVSPGDLLTFGLSRSNVGDGSTLGATNVPIGTQGNLLTVQNDDTLQYEKYGIVQKFISVDPIAGVDDVDDPDVGVDPNKPCKTIKFACELADDGQDTHKTINVKTGLYFEILPITVPKKTAIVGDELRSVTIKPADAIYTSADLPDRQRMITHLKSILRSIVTNQVITKTPSNAENQVFVIDREVTSGGVGVEEEQVVETPIFGDTGTADQIDTNLDEFMQYANYAVGGTGVAPSYRGINNIITDETDLNGARAIVANKKFAAAETVAYMKTYFTDYAINEADVIADVKRYIDALEYDIQYTGNYKTYKEAIFYSNKCNGSDRTDMFYVRDASGVRNCSIQGLTGTLNPPNVFDQYQRPTGPNYVSLDPGWGPDHQECWIMTRSPYIQNVTTSGTNCTGQKIDGALHNGGNKSIVSNDFTQVISDGIGAHVLNNGRAELVSVFTYYAQVGYLAENGGVIRATNGNCSYGFIGALADGTDPSETPINATVNNRTQQAIVTSAFAGEVNDFILAFEFANCGQNYTEAQYNVVGSGTGLDVIQEEFRDDSMFEARIVTGDASAAAGGGGFTLVGNNAQSGNETQITLATSDDNEEANLLGLRILITSGPGTGQYGIVNEYNSITKVLKVIKETDGTAGWDHVIAGTPSETLLTTNSRYRFEPRIIFSDPVFSSSQVTFTAGTTWSDVVYAETSKTFTGIIGDPGAGTTIEVIPATATFDVIKTGKEYTVTLRSGGAGYTVGDVIVLEGEGLDGGADNDITITVTSISNDSTNSIVTFDSSGTASSGRFVAIASTGSTTQYSSDGTNWETGALPSSGAWKGIVAGATGFVAFKELDNEIAYSADGVAWGSSTLPANTDWQEIAYGGGVYVAISKAGNNAAFSTDGISWTAANIPAGGDSTFDEWTSITYGQGKFVAVSSSQNLAVVGEYNGSTIVWNSYIMDVIGDSSQKDWFSVRYGNNRFFAVAPTGETAYSFDGITWYPGTMPTPDGSTVLRWNDFNYGQGLFVATADTAGQVVDAEPTLGPVDYIYQSPDGIYWTKKTVASEGNWGPVCFGNPDITDDANGDNRKGIWIVLNKDVTTSNHLRVLTGATAKGRCNVEAGRISVVKLWEPGSGYGPTGPTYTVVDPNNTGELVLDTTRIADRVLAQPSFRNRGSKYKTSTTSVNISGDGFADIIPVGKFVFVSGMPIVIGPGAQLRLNGNEELYTVVAIEQESVDADDTFTLKFRVSPELKIENDTYHNTAVTINTRYSQCRISGHDFLDIGTGNFTETNYPALYSVNYLSYPENEVQELNGGRVFYTSTDQSGNFRCGELFAVEQATGIVTISADFFDLNGLTELALGGIRVGGTGTVIREFSTDPLFTADSNNIVPTQRAIKAYLTNRLNVGGADLLTASFIAGTVKVGPNAISNSANLTNQIPVIADFYGPKANIQGSMLAQAMFFRSFKNRAD